MFEHLGIYMFAFGDIFSLLRMTDYNTVSLVFIFNGEARIIHTCKIGVVLVIVKDVSCSNYASKRGC